MIGIPLNPSLRSISDTIKIEQRTLHIVESWPIYSIDDSEGLIKWNRKVISILKSEIDSFEGVVYVSFWVEKDGKTTQHKIQKGISDNVDFRILEMSKKIKFDLPATQRGKAVRVQYTLPFHFGLKNEE
jgi:TonB family protein